MTTCPSTWKAHTIEGDEIKSNDCRGNDTEYKEDIIRRKTRGKKRLLLFMNDKLTRLTEERPFSSEYMQVSWPYEMGSQVVFG